MGSSDLVTLIVATLSLVAAIAAQRQSAKSSKNNSDAVIAVSRTDLETEAYVRARALDTETIARQGLELIELRTEVTKVEKKYDFLAEKYEDLLDQNRALKTRIAEIEKHERKP